ncbi:MAG: glycosyltransferase family 39 protein, partial [Patescibacteria group bacterium]
MIIGANMKENGLDFGALCHSDPPAGGEESSECNERNIYANTRSFVASLLRMTDGESSWPKRLAFLLVFLLGAYFLTRLYGLGKLPVFVDEAIYVRWAQVMRTEPGLRFIPLQDGKQPLFMWLTIPFLKLVSDPLLAGRMVSVVAGFGTLLGVLALPLVLGWGLVVSLLAGFFYLIAPFTLFFDRMALVDSLLSAFGIWALLFAVLLGKYKRLDLAMILGMILGGAWLTKSPAMIFLLMTPLVVLFSQKNRSWRFWEKKKSELGDLFKKIILLGVVGAFAYGIYNILRLGPEFQMIAIRNKDYVWPISEILKHPWDPIKPHLGDVIRYYRGYLTPPLAILGVLGVIFAPKVLAIWWLLPLLAQSAIAKVFTARYILYGVPIFLILAAKFLTSLEKKWGRLVFWGILAWISVYCLIFDFKLLTNPAQAPFPRNEREGYLQDWTAGWGIKEIAEYLKTIPRDKGIVVGTEGYF